MANYANWRAVSTALATESDKWDAAGDAARVLWIQLLLLGDNYGAHDADPYIVWRNATKHLGWTRAKTTTALKKLVAIGLVHTFDTKLGEWLHIADFEEHQHGDYLRKRGTQRGPVPPCSEGRSGCRFGQRPAKGRSKGRRHNNNYEDNYNDNTSIVDDESKPSTSPTRQVFDHWVEVDVATGGGSASGRILNAARRDKIQARLNEGYTVEQMCTAITAYCNDPWHLGKHERNKTRYTELVTLLKTGSKVEAGLQKAAEQTERRSTSFVKVGAHG